VVRGKHGVIRSAGPDDAAFLRQLYRPDRPIAGLLDDKREVAVPTWDELREALGTNTQTRQANWLNAVEDLNGDVRGFCALRASPLEQYYGLIIGMFLDEDDFDSPLAEEAGAFLVMEAFQRKRLHKVVAYSLEHEAGFRRWLLRIGFTPDGRQRDVLWAAGRWFGLDAFSLFNGQGRAAATRAVLA
jgi:RimJ/RimL family protein N-acetyltransferase